MAFLDYVNRLRAYVPILSLPQAEDYINYAWRDIREANDSWSFLEGVQYWYAPAAMILNGLSTTQFDADVELSYGNLSQIGDVTFLPVTQRQLRFGLSGGPIYGIESTDVLKYTDLVTTATSTTVTSPGGTFTSDQVGLKILISGAGAGGDDLETTVATFVSTTEITITDAAGTSVNPATGYIGSILTLDRLYMEQTNSNASAQMYRIYYSPVDSNFARLDALYDPIMGYEFGWQIWPADELNRIDPQRASQTQPYELFYREHDAETDLPVYEMWPGPTSEKTYTVTYWKSGTDFTSDSESLPGRIPEELLLTRARMIALEWAQTQDPDYRRRSSYAGAYSIARSRYSTEGVPGARLGLLDKALKNDRSVTLSKARIRPRRPGPGWPVDSNFMQRHAIPAGFGYGAY